MLNFVMSSVNPGTGRAIPNWVRLVNDIDNRLDLYRQRTYTGPQMLSPCIALMKFIVSYIDLNYLLTDRSIYDKYAQYIAGAADGLKAVYDPVSGSKKISCFTKKVGSTKVPEFCLNVEVDNPLSNLPLTAGWEVWKSMRPIRIVDYDSLELPYNLIAGQLWFKTLQPTRVVSSIDFTIFTIKLMKYMEYYKLTPNTLDALKFVYLEVFYQWYEDIVDIWLLNFITTAAMHKYMSVDQLEINAQVSGVPNLLQMKYVVTNEMDRVKTGTTLFEQFMATPWFTHGKSMVDLVTTRTKDLSVPDLRQYKYLQFMSEFPLIRLMAVVNSYRGDNGAGVKIKLAIKRIIERYENANILTHIIDPVLRAKVQADINEVYSYTEPE